MKTYTVPGRIVEKASREQVSEEFVLIVRQPVVTHDRVEYDPIEPDQPMTLEIVKNCSDLFEARIQFDCAHLFDENLLPEAFQILGGYTLHDHRSECASVIAGESISVLFGSPAIAFRAPYGDSMVTHAPHAGTPTASGRTTLRTRQR